jgi:hypothetical protein
MRAATPTAADRSVTAKSAVRTTSSAVPSMGDAGASRVPASAAVDHPPQLAATAGITRK